MARHVVRDSCIQVEAPKTAHVGWARAAAGHWRSSGGTASSRRPAACRCSQSHRCIPATQHRYRRCQSCCSCPGCRRTGRWRAERLRQRSGGWSTGQWHTGRAKGPRRDAGHAHQKSRNAGPGSQLRLPTSDCGALFWLCSSCLHWGHRCCLDSRLLWRRGRAGLGRCCSDGSAVMVQQAANSAVVGMLAGKPPSRRWRCTRFPVPGADTAVERTWVRRGQSRCGHSQQAALPVVGAQPCAGIASGTGGAGPGAIDAGGAVVLAVAHAAATLGISSQNGCGKVATGTPGRIRTAPTMNTAQLKAGQGTQRAKELG